MATSTYPGIPTDFKSRLKPSADLVERHGTTAKYHGGASFKSKASAAKRTATTLRKTADELKETASAADLQALLRAAQVLDRQAEDLAVFARWADQYKTFSDQRRLGEDTASAQALAQARWGDDPAAYQLDLMLLEECDSLSGGERFGLYVLKNHHRFAGVKPQNFMLSGYRSTSLTGADERTNTAHRIASIDARSSRYERASGEAMAMIGRDIFDAYVADRRAALGRAEQNNP
ncbi:hypothetical protein [Hydrogenophaga laconesensis]|uniref:Uncharacterized protein n=1 Tax=Hydrogenophaga laconesensis TaxID=1805971 RepID=A0ABU1VJM1_9BURK|nr:hypothetical protein [Hydrogenophaga laconesensis]MDR7097493.1 hypothetical protein [Hydrogenophaga laconesensis]